MIILYYHYHVIYVIILELFRVYIRPGKQLANVMSLFTSLRITELCEVQKVCNINYFMHIRFECP